MTALDIEIAVIKYFNPRQNIIVPNVSWGLWNKEYKTLHECDIISLTGSSWATEIEIKVSKADLLKDNEKRHGHTHNLIRRLYFAVPEEMKDFALANIPERAGLIVVSARRNANRGYVEFAKECKINKQAVKWTDKQRFQLARLGAMRILGLKEKIKKLTER